MDISPLLHPLDLYCERVDASFWSEPLNLISNAAFMVAALAIQQKSRRAIDSRPCRQLRVLSRLCLAVGVGSALFHALPNRLTQTADVLPIAILVLTSLSYYFQNLSREGRNIRNAIALGMILIALPGLIARASGLDRWLSQGEFYLGIPAALLSFAAFDPSPARTRLLLGGAFVFMAAFLARTLDLFLCPFTQVGTHFLWHLLAAATVYRVALLLFAFEPQNVRSQPDGPYHA